MDIETYFILSRYIFDSAIWRDDPHTLKLFIWLVGNARHKKEPKKYPHVIINRGELVTSLANIAENNEYVYRNAVRKWSRAMVSRMLAKLEEENYIKLISDTYGTHINICNYDRYQDPKRYKPDSSETDAKQVCNSSETDSRINKNVKNDNNVKNVKNVKKDTNTKENVTKETISLKFDEFYFLYPRKIGRKKAEDKFILIVKKNIAEPDIIINKLKAQLEANMFNLTENKKYCPHPVTWLSQSRWEDEIIIHKPKMTVQEESIDNLKEWYYKHADEDKEITL
uniref:Uncharacterized protein n=1 Tax=viral metagenome TaxID=1070528 RepID=A0A6M3L685_9ZZZZ